MKKVRIPWFLIAYVLAVITCIVISVMYTKFILESDIPEWLKFILIR